MFDGMIFRSGRGLWSAAVLAVFAAAAAAGPETSVTKVDVVSLPSKTKEIRLLRSFPTERDEAKGIYFSQPQSLSTDPHGRIYVSDVKECQVWVFGPDGRFLAKLGRSGQGPGELRSVYEIRYKPMQDKLARNKAQAKTAAGGGRVIGQSIIESIWATDRSFYVLYHGPRIEILEFMRDGTFAKIYWTLQTTDYYPRDLAVFEEGGWKTFLLLQAAPDYKVDVFIEK